MDGLSFTKLKLLSESTKLLDVVEKQNWELYPALNSSFQQLLKVSIEKYGSQLDSISDQLFQDNDALQQAITEQQKQATEERKSLISASKALKAYLKDSF